MYKVEQHVKRKVKVSTKLLKALMIALAVFFLLLAIAFRTGYMMFCFIFALLYFIFDANSGLEYDYIFEDGRFTINVIKGKRKRYQAHQLDLSQLEVIARPDDECVKKYKKGSTEEVKKFDYTSYDDDVLYYTMIIYEDGVKIKLLLDLNEEMIVALKRKYCAKIII